MVTSPCTQVRSSRIRPLAAAAILGTVVCGAAHGQSETVWKCWYNQDTRLQCVLQAAATDALPDPRYLHNARLPQPVKQLWTDPASVAGKSVFVPLFTEPEDWDRVRLLAESVLCGANRACFVDLGPSVIASARFDPVAEE